jgi:hypothetical protein
MGHVLPVRWRTTLDDDAIPITKTSDIRLKTYPPGLKVPMPGSVWSVVRLNYRPLNRGLRRSRNAATPSL